MTGAHRLLKSRTFRITLIYLCVLIFALVALLGAVYWSTTAAVSRQIESTIDAELRGLAEQFNQRGLVGLIRAIERRASRDENDRALYLLTDSGGHPLAGNLDRWPDGPADAEESETAAALDLTPVVHHAGQLAVLANAARKRAEPLDVHVEVDTGMSRTGVPVDRAGALFEAISREPALAMTGIFTHFARADEEDLGPSFEQLRAFGLALGEARKRGLDPGVIHVANSAALLAGKPLVEALPEQTAARPGGMLFGVRPAPHLAGALRPAMTLRTRVAQLRSVKSGDPVGYSALFRARRDTRIATLPIGYDDGVPVSASGRGSVLIRGRRMPIAGQISMNFISVDVGDSPIEIGDDVILFGEGQGDVRLSVEEAAAAAETVAYELLVRVGRRVPRQFED